MDKPRWWTFGQHEYKDYVNAQTVSKIREELGDTMRIITVKRDDGTWYVVQIFEI